MAIQNYTITEDFVLPSQGKVYGDVGMPAEIKIRSMTTVDEMNRISPNERKHKSMANVLDACVVSEIPISTYDMHIGDFQYLIHKLRVVTYGPEYPLKCTCPYCLSTYDETINLDELVYKVYSDDVGSENEFDLPVTGKHITLRMQTPRLLDDISLASTSQKKKGQVTNQQGSAFLYTLKYLIKEVDGEKVDPILLEDFVKSLPMKDANYLLRKAEKSVDELGLIDELSIVCPVCGLTYDSPFRITEEFFGPSI